MNSFLSEKGLEIGYVVGIGIKEFGDISSEIYSYLHRHFICTI